MMEHSLKQSCFSEVLGDDNVRNRLEYKLYVTCVCGACDVCVDRLAAGVSVEPNKLVSDEIHPILVGVSSYKKVKKKHYSIRDIKQKMIKASMMAPHPWQSEGIHKTQQSNASMHISCINYR